MTDLLTTVTLDAANGFNDESVVSTFVFKTADVVDADLMLDIHNAISEFYNALKTGQVATVASYIGAHIDRTAGASKLKTYDITAHTDGSPYGSPIAIDSFTLGAANGALSFPTQVAAALTLRGRNALEQPVEGPLGIRPRARRSGRLFLGPLNASAGSTAGGVLQRPANQFRADVLAAAEGLQDNLIDGETVWSVWSRTTATVWPIERVEMDDSFDVIRSRKLRPTTRTSRTFVPEPAPVLGA